MELMFITTMLQVLILLIVTAILFTGYQLLKRRVQPGIPRSLRRQNKPVESVAVVLAMEETGVFMNSQPLMKLQMQVIPDRGRNFVVEVRELRSSIDKDVRSGSTVRVKYNPSNTKETVLVRR